MATTADIAKRYFAALAAHDLDEALACWQPGAVDRFEGTQELIAPDGVRRYLSELFAAFPEFLLRDPRPDDPSQPHGGALAGPGHLRRTRIVHGL